MKSRLVAVLALFSLLVFALPALAKKTTVPARTPATLRADAKDDADSLGTIKKGEALTVLGAQGDWSNVQTAAGKKGWVKTSVVAEKSAGLDSLHTDSSSIASAEGDTASAIRGKGVKRKTAVVGVSGLSSASLKSVATQLKGIPQVTVVDMHSEKGAVTGVDGAKPIGTAKKADLVVLVSSLSSGALSYEFIDLKTSTEIGKGETTDAKGAAKEIGAALNKALVPAPATTSTTGAMTHPNAPLPMAGDCVQKCVDSHQMDASTPERIKSDCEKQCAGPATK